MELPIRKSSILRIMTYDDRQPDMTSSEISVVGLAYQTHKFALGLMINCHRHDLAINN
jgi:hypothetical protein